MTRDDVHIPDRIVERLGRLELQNRRIRRAGIVSFLLICVAILMGQSGPKTKTLEAQEIIIRDEHGKKRLTLGRQLDRVGLYLYDDHETQVATLNISDTFGSGGLFLLDESGEARVGLTLFPDGSPILRLSGKGEKAGAILEAGIDGAAGIRLLDGHGRPRLRIMTKADGTPSVSLLDDTDKTRVALLSGSSSGLILFDRHGTQRAWLVLPAKLDDKPSLTLFDETGEAIWQPR